MAIIQLPQVGESVTEGIIGKWLKQVGDRVEKYDPLVEVMTDKVNMEFPSPWNGVLTKILVKEGDTVPMGAPIAEMEVEGGEPAAEEAAPETQATQPEREEMDQRLSRIGTLLKDVRPVGPTGSGQVAPPLGEEVAPAPVTERERARYSPVVRRLAQEHGVDLSHVKGTGMGSRITREDVLKFIEAQKGAPAGAPTISTPTAPPTRKAGPADEELPLSPLRRIIADNMTKSTSQIPHAWTTQEVDVTGLVQRREGAKEEFQRREGVPLTYLPFIAKAAAAALKEYSILNASWGGNKIILKKRINVGIAVAAQEGLVVPVIHDADSLDITRLAAACHDLVERARQGKLTLEDVQGGTFTVNNTGALGSVVSMSIINYHQAAILTAEAIVKRPVVRDDAIVIRSMMNICLSFDHRVMDGLAASAFLTTVRAHLEAIGPETPLS